MVFLVFSVWQLRFIAGCKFERRKIALNSVWIVTHRNMVLSLREYELANKSDDVEIWNLLELRNTVRTFYRQCGADREIQDKLDSFTREKRYNNSVIHSSVST
jgi:hypothetical protein